VSEFVAIRVDDFYLEEAMLHIRKGKGRKERYVPILPELAQELRTHLGDRKAGHLFETRAARAYGPRRVQQLVREIAVGRNPELPSRSARSAYRPVLVGDLRWGPVDVALT
jgi:integrase